MATAVLPFADVTISDATGCIIRRGPSSLVALATKNSVEIRDFLQRGRPITASFVRSDQSVSELGGNVWVEWVSKTRFAVGTDAQRVLLCDITNGIIEMCAMVEIENIIIGAFVCHGIVGVCTPAADIMFLSPDGLVKCRCPFGTDVKDVAAPKQCGPSVIALVIDGCPILTWVPDKLVHAIRDGKKSPKLKLTPFPIKDAIMVAFNQEMDILAVMVVDYDIIAVPIRRGLVSTMHNIGDSAVTFFEWIAKDTVLCIVQIDGCMTLYNAFTETVTCVQVPQLVTATSIAYENVTQCLIYANAAGVGVIEFVTIAQGDAFTCSCVVNLRKSCVLFDSGPLYPIQGIWRTGSSFVLRGIDRIGSYANGELCTRVCNAKQIAAYKDFILCFGIAPEDGSWMMEVRDFSLKTMSKCRIGHAVYTVTSDGEHVVIGSHSRYSVITLSEDNPSGEATALVKDRLFCEMMMHAVDQQIRNAVYCTEFGVLAHSRDGRIRDLAETRRWSMKHVRYILCCAEEKVFIARTRDGIHLVVNDTSYLFADRDCLFTCKGYAYTLAPECSFGCVVFDVWMISPYVIIAQPVEFMADAIRRYIDHDINEIMFSCLTIAVRQAKRVQLSNLLKCACEVLDKTIVASIVSRYVREVVIIKDERCEFFFGVDLPWHLFFEALSDEVKSLALMNMDPMNFDNVLTESGECAYFADKKSVSAFARESITLSNYVRGFRVSYEHGVRFADCARDYRVFSSPDLAVLVPAFRDEHRVWRTISEGMLHCMGTAFIHAGMNVVALAIFLAVDERPKVSALFFQDHRLRIVADDFMRLSGDCDISMAIRSCLSDGSIM